MVEAQAGPAGWPFLVARGLRRGYRVLLVPGLLADHRLDALLAEALVGASPPGLPRVETVAAPGLGPVCCAYRTERFAEPGAGGQPGRAMLDEHGRPLEILYGVLCATDGVLEPDPADLGLARTEALATYRRFLADEGGFTPERSHAVALRSTLSPRAPGVTAPAAPARPEEPAPGSSATAPAGPSRLPVGKGLAVAVVAALVVALAGTAWALVLRSPAGRVVDVRVDVPQVAGVECGRTEAIRVDAYVTTDGRAQVAYHWEDPLDGWRSGRTKVAFRGGGSRRVHLSRQVSVSAGETLDRSISLVVDAPNHASDTADYTLSCYQP